MRPKMTDKTGEVAHEGGIYNEAGIMGVSKEDEKGESREDREGKAQRKEY